ncbi:hypothetical protein [Flavobacterium succinicans]|uniref:Uncharacterized protein n=1 Tax=Flavobacterium succinicans TaxID=29536 RepID=A0A199XSA0_9FLAO|nr:hypothetical protein [Flavobacterium succinicans]OAZ04297.1 hypothetical protein FLB_12920 [Flavobacterium succinicans]
MKYNQSLNQEDLTIFTKSINSKLEEGFILEERNDALPFAVLSKKPKRVNHKLNFKLSCVTLGAWSIVWLYLSHISKAKKIVVGLDEDGNVFQENCYMG